MFAVPFLNKNEIYIIPPLEKDAFNCASFWLYAPISGILMQLTKDEIVKLEKTCLDIKSESDSETKEVLKLLLDNENSKPVNYVKSPYDVCALTILPTARCNFSCSYCYAANGHANKELDEKQMVQVLDFFIDPKRLKKRDLYISFGGGGEPFLMWPLVIKGISYAQDRASHYGFTLHFSFASNGSIINDEIIDSIIKYKIKANISFDILEHIQELQRKDFNSVCRTLDKLLESDIIPSINTVITPANVNLQKEMVIFMAKRFPKIKRLSFDAVVDASLYDNPVEFEKFFKSYTQNFFDAYRTGKEHGVDVSCIKLKNTELLRDRACPGGFDLTPEGTISICFFISSPLEPLYKDFIYGKVNDNGLMEFDLEKFQNMISNDINNDICKKCFAKWHCGGGCYFQNRSYNQKTKEILCNFIRDFTLNALIVKYEETQLSKF
ncbi:MAG: radical SAM protein [Bacteroidales bacterium]|nr:radical SAM protein [Bacteroidales bacterium]